MGLFLICPSNCLLMNDSLLNAVDPNSGLTDGSDD